jgi:heme/copper-type cytochrome/quinol oxidase subunit 1
VIDRATLGDPRLVGFIASSGLCVVGWVLGALIRGSTTMIPAHYHAAIGAVTVAFMTVSWPLLEALGIRAKDRLSLRLIPWQPAVFGVGQALFAVGFAIAGTEGTARKVFGHEQQVRTPVQSLGLGVMGIGSALAIGAGVLFLVIVAAAWLGRESRVPIAVPRRLEPQPSGGPHV